VLDLKWVRENQVAFREGLEKRAAGALFESVFSLHQAWRERVSRTQELQEQKNRLAQTADVKRVTGTSESESKVEELVASATKIRQELALAAQTSSQLKEQLDALLASVPNMPASDVPSGSNEFPNVEIKAWGEKPAFSYPPQSHDALGKHLHQMDFETAARMSGSRFVVLKGALARLERALANFMLDIHTQEFGYLEVSPPYLVNESAVCGVGQLPKFADDLFKTTDGRWLEVSVTSMVAGQILREEELPLRYTAYTPCFRSEAGAAGSDTRGMVRLHQFSKVELVHITTPQKSEAEYESLCTAAETILQRLNLPYRTVLLCGGDLGFSARRTRDLEVWLPAQEKYR